MWWSSNDDRLTKQLMRLTRNDPKQTELFLSWYGTIDVKALAACLKKNRTVRKLYLRGNDIGPKGMVNLLSALKDNDTIESLHLGENQIGDEGAAGIGEFLRENSSLKTLFLMGNSITSKGAVDLADSLCDNDTLRVLHLSKNDIGREGATALAKMLSKNQELKRLYLHSNPIDTVGKHQLMETLERHNFFLQELDFGDRSLQGEIWYYTRLNKAGRRLLRQDNDVPDALWTMIMASSTKEPDLLYYFVQAKPDLFNRRV